MLNASLNKTFPFLLDPCFEGGYEILDDYRRYKTHMYKEAGPDDPLCDVHMSAGWYRFLINGSDAVMATECVGVC